MISCVKSKSSRNRRYIYLSTSSLSIAYQWKRVIFINCSFGIRLFPYTLNLGSDGKEAADTKSDSATITDIGVHSDVFTDVDSITATSKIAFKMKSPIDFSIAGATLDVWPYSEKSSRRRLASKTPALDACYPESTSNACEVASMTWSPIHVKKDTLTEINATLSLKGSSDLLKDIVWSIVNRKTVNIKTKGLFVLPTYSGPLIRSNKEVGENRI